MFGHEEKLQDEIEELKNQLAKSIDKQTAVNFAQHLLKDHTTQEVTLSDLNDFLNIKQP